MKLRPLQYKKVVSALAKIGFEVIRQKGSDHPPDEIIKKFSSFHTK